MNRLTNIGTLEVRVQTISTLALHLSTDGRDQSILNSVLRLERHPMGRQ